MDTDVLGGGGKNAGFVVERDADGLPVAVRMVKIDAGESFNFSSDANQFVQAFNPMPTANKLDDLKDFQFGNCQPKNIRWNNLSETQKNTFLRALKRGLEFLSNERVLDFLIYREGQFDKAVDGDRRLMIDDLVLPFRGDWKRYRDCQRSETVYGSLKVDLPEPTTTFVPARYGAVDFKSSEIMKLCTGGMTK